MDTSSHYKKLMTTGALFLSIASLLLAVFTIRAVASWFGPESLGKNGDTIPQISVTGTGDVFAVPDLATFTFSVIEDAKTVADAQSQATDRVNKAIDYLKKAGIEDKDIKTESYNINPKYEYQTASANTSSAIRCVNCGTNQVLVGYEVTQSVSVKVRKTDQAGTILSGLGSLGVQNVSGITLSVDDQDAVMAQARQKAIEDAKAKANVLADQLGVNLVRIISYSEQGSNYYPLAYGKGAALDSSALPAVPPQIPTGQNKITSTVTITYEIK